MKGKIVKEVKPLTKEQVECLAKHYNMGASSEEAAEEEKKKIVENVKKESNMQ